MSGNYPEGIDYEWLAADTKGRVARFTTGGLGPIPMAVVEARGASETVEDAIAKLQRRGPARLFVNLPDPTDFVRIAEIGIYAYDCDDISTGSRMRRYRLVSIPTSPLTVADLPPVARDAASLARLSDVAFGETIEIGPEQLGETVSAG